ncbi:MAG: hypothetical protein JW967_03455 [Dehalococcoidales bacterium]|nr:hypothetical protein [Dehalococcoidales bacterium]
MFRLTLSSPPFSAEVSYTGTGVLAYPLQALQQAVLRRAPTELAIRISR